MDSENTRPLNVLVMVVKVLLTLLSLGLGISLLLLGGLCTLFGFGDLASINYSRSDSIQTICIGVALLLAGWLVLYVLFRKTTKRR